MCFYNITHSNSNCRHAHTEPEGTLDYEGDEDNDDDVREGDILDSDDDMDHESIM